MLRSVIILIILSIPFTGYAQQTDLISNKYAPGVTEIYHVLKTNGNIKQGLYQVFYKRKILIASGYYTQNKRSGIWYFYNIAGLAVQRYNYDKKRPLALGMEDTSSNIINYNIVNIPQNTDSVSIPVRIGGIFYGYLPYIKKFK